ncbi:MAG: nitroreductase family protein [Acidimicrobiia bacterium]
MVAADLDLTPRELLTTTRTVRKRLDLTRPVEREVVEDCLKLAFQAPNGGDQQTWNWVLVDDEATRAEMARIYLLALQDHIDRPRKPRANSSSSEGRPPDTPKQQRMNESIMHLMQHLAEVPVLLVPTFHGRCERGTLFEQASRWGSIAPGIWSFMLALRLRGLGSAWTTLHLYREQEMAELLGIPYETETQAGLFPVAYTIGTDFKVADRSASERQVHWNGWNRA